MAHRHALVIIIGTADKSRIMNRYLLHWLTFTPVVAVIVLAFAWGNVLGLLAVAVVAESMSQNSWPCEALTKALFTGGTNCFVSSIGKFMALNPSRAQVLRNLCRIRSA